MSEDESKKPTIDYKVVPTPVVSEYAIIEIGERYGITINPDDATQYKLCQVIYGLEAKLASDK